MSAANTWRLTKLLCDASREGRWRPLDESNIQPLAAVTAKVLDAAGCVIVPPIVASSMKREHGELVMDLVVALEAGDYVGADDADFIETMARSMWGLGWRHPISSAAGSSQEVDQ